MSSENRIREAEEKDTNRLEAFSDGVFAIAITLLVLEMKVPQNLGEGKSLTDALLSLWTSYAAFVISFLTILIMWINHHRLFKVIKRTNTMLLVSNGILLMFITFIPFPTAVLAAYIDKPDQTAAAVFNSITYFFIAVSFNLLWWSAAYKKRLLDPRSDTEMVKAITFSYYFGPPLYLLSGLLAFFSVAASLLLVLGLAFFFAFSRSEIKTTKD
jgi:uncharacterized membrane protein